MQGFKVINPYPRETQHFKDDNLLVSDLNKEHLNSILMALKPCFEPSMIFNNGRGL